MEEKPKCKILYFSLSDEMRKEEKLEWFRDTKFEDIDFERIRPDQKGNWINLTDNDFDSLIPVCAKETKLGKGGNAIFQLFSNGIVSSRDEWICDFSEENLQKKVEFFCNFYEKEKERWSKSNKQVSPNDFVDRTIKFGSELVSHLVKGSSLIYNEKCLRTIHYRPYTKKKTYIDKIISHRLYQLDHIFGILDKVENVFISLTFHNQLAYPSILCGTEIWDYGYGARDTTGLPLYRYEKGEKVENITDWALALFEKRYESLENRELSIEDRDLSVDNTPPSILDPRISKLDPQISKTDIFHYVYAVLHNPEYRTKYAQNLKRDFPKIPLYADFWKYADAGKKLMDLHLNYEKIEERVLRVEDRANLNTLVPRPNPLAPRPKLKANKELGEIYIDEQTTLTGVPPLAWEYKLGNRSALEWVLDQYKEKKPSDPTILEKFNTYRFADYKESVIELLQKVCYISVQTMQIVNNFVTQTLVCDKNQKKQCQN